MVYYQTCADYDSSDVWHTKQVDYANIFAQAEIQEEVYIEPHQRFGGADKKILNGLK